MLVESRRKAPSHVGALVVLFGAMAIALLGPGQGNTQSGVPGTVGVISAHSGLGWDVSGASVANGAIVQQWGTPLDYRHRRFILTHRGGRDWMIQAAHSGKCLQISGSSLDNGAPLEQWDCHGGANQVFEIGPGAPGEIRVNYSRKCLEVGGWSTSNGGIIQQWDCHNGANQKWSLR